jgi:peptide/nickel transport system substrate-binding protein
MVAPGINGYMKDLDKRPALLKPDEAKKMLADAGYPNGFEVGMDCPNDRYVNDEKICQAVVAMLAKIGVKVNLRAQTRNLYFAKILRKNDLSPGETSFYMLGWSPAKRDAEIAEATKLYVDDFAYIPLHQQAVVWAARKNIDLVQPADNSFPLRFVTVK